MILTKKIIISFTLGSNMFTKSRYHYILNHSNQTLYIYEILYSYSFRQPLFCYLWQ